MKIKTNKKQIINQLKAVVSAINPKLTEDSLDNICIHSAVDNLVIEGCNFDQHIEASIETEIIKKSEKYIYLNGASFLKIIDKIKKGDIFLEVEGDFIKISNNDLVYQLPFNQEGWIAQAQRSNGLIERPQVLVDGQELLKAINKVEHAISKDETRFYLNGVYFNFKNSVGEIVATNGHVLSITKLNYFPNDIKFDVIIPRSSISTIKKMLVDAKKVSISVLDGDKGKKHLCFLVEEENYNKMRLGTKVIDGDFPDYKKNIPQTDQEIIVPAEKFLEIVEAGSKMCEDRNSALNFVICGQNLSINNDSNNPLENKIKFHQDLVLENEANDYDFRLNSKFVVSILKAFLIEKQNQKIKIKYSIKKDENGKLLQVPMAFSGQDNSFNLVMQLKNN